jgi:hypothetical protein
MQVADWEQEWIDEAIRLLRDMYEHHYRTAPSTQTPPAASTAPIFVRCPSLDYYPAD